MGKLGVLRDLERCVRCIGVVIFWGDRATYAGGRWGDGGFVEPHSSKFWSWSSLVCGGRSVRWWTWKFGYLCLLHIHTCPTSSLRVHLHIYIHSRRIPPVSSFAVILLGWLVYDRQRPLSHTRNQNHKNPPIISSSDIHLYIHWFLSVF